MFHLCAQNKQIKMNVILEKNPLFAPLVKDFDWGTGSPELRERFEKDYRKELDALWERFLFGVALERAQERCPALSTPIRDCPLSSRAKNCLAAAGAQTLADVAVYSLRDLSAFRNMGASTLEEIERYMKEVLDTARA